MSNLKGFSASDDSISVEAPSSREMSSKKLLKSVKKRSSRQWFIAMGVGVVAIALIGSGLTRGGKKPSATSNKKANAELVVETTPRGAEDSRGWREQTAIDINAMRKELQQSKKAQDDLLQVIGSLRSDMADLRKNPPATMGSPTNSRKPVGKAGADKTGEILLPDPPKPPPSLALPKPPVSAQAAAVNETINPQKPIDLAPPPTMAAAPVVVSPARSFIPKASSGPSSEELQYASYEKNASAGLLPAGSFAKATLISGVEAFTGGTAQSQPQPIVVRIDSNAILPNAAKYRIRGCHVLASVWGDMSSERVYGRLATLTCVNTAGHLVLSQEVEGVLVDSDGKNGIRGSLQDRQGAKLARSLLAGLAKGMSDALGGAQTTSFVTGAGVSSVVTGDRLATAGYGGVGQAADQLSQFYLKQAEATMPVIAVDAGRRISVLFTKSEPLKFESVATYKPKTQENVVVGRPSGAQ